MCPLTDAAHLHEDGAEVTPDYSKLQVPSAKTLKSLDDVNTKFFIGTEVTEVHTRPSVTLVSDVRG